MNLPLRLRRSRIADGSTEDGAPLVGCEVGGDAGGEYLIASSKLRSLYTTNQSRGWVIAAADFNRRGFRKSHFSENSQDQVFYTDLLGESEG
jgi:hypothetical protein